MARMARDATTRHDPSDDPAPARPLSGMPGWRRWLFALMSAACVPAAEYFHLPADDTTEVRVPEGDAYGTKR
jgi:hypothetical protein